MIKFLRTVIFTGWVLSLTACNLPLGRNVPTPDVIATQVAATMQVVVVATATNSSIPGGSPVNPQTTPSATIEATVTLTPTVSPSPTPDISDPAILLGEPAYQNNLDSASAFFSGGSTSYEDSYSRFRVAGGVLEMTSFNPTGWRGWRLTSRQPGRFYVEGTFNTVACSGSDHYGLVVRAPDYGSGQGYYFGLTCDGRYALQVWTASGVSSIQDFTRSDEIKAGPGQTNRMGLWVDGAVFKVYLNGKLIKEFNSSTITAPGYLGVYIASTSAPNTVVQLDRIAYWNLP